MAGTQRARNGDLGDTSQLCVEGDWRFPDVPRADPGPAGRIYREKDAKLAISKSKACLSMYKGSVEDELTGM